MKNLLRLDIYINFINWKEWLNFLNRLKNYTTKESKPKLKQIKPSQTSLTRQELIRKNISLMDLFSWISTINKKLTSTTLPYSSLFNKLKKASAKRSVTTKIAASTHVKLSFLGLPDTVWTISKESTSTLTFQQWTKKSNDPSNIWSHKLKISLLSIDLNKIMYFLEFLFNLISIIIRFNNHKTNFMMFGNVIGIFNFFILNKKSHFQSKLEGFND